MFVIPAHTTILELLYPISSTNDLNERRNRQRERERKEI
jgi:hypothetical protein